MAKFRIETQISLLAVIIVAAVVISGYYTYKNLSEIVTSVHQAARPDNKLFMLKDISADLAALENNGRLYVLTGSRRDLRQYDTLKLRVAGKLELLIDMMPPQSADAALVDTFSQLSLEKLGIWRQVIALHNQNKNVEEPEFTEIYSRLEEQKFDTIQVEKTAEQKGLLRKIFGKKKTVVDTTIVELGVESEAIKNQLDSIRTEITESRQRTQQVNALESNLVARNIVINDKLNQLISRAEKQEADNLIRQTQEADDKAAITYERLAIFSATAVALLLVVLFLLFNYLKKARRYERGLQKARQEAENLALAKEKFAANVSHEMRTPVNAIYGLAEQMLHRRSNDDLNEQVAVLAQSASHLNNIINDTLDFSKIQAGKIKFDKVHFSPAQVIKEVIALQKYGAAQKGLALTYSAEGELPAAIVGDPLRLKQVLINLIGNAIKFTDQGEVELKASSTKLLNNYHRMLFEVNDTGIGISKEDQKIIFDEFVQAENGDGKKYKGTGLGLAIVKKLVELQSGKIEVDSTPGLGTSMKVAIPYPAGDVSKVRESEFDAPDIPEVFSNLKVLVADDEPFNRFLFKGIFNKWRTGFEEAENGAEAVEMVMKDHFDIVLMDMRMPKMNGVEATKAILAQKPATKIVAITATTDEAEKKACREAGMLAFLPKPFSEKKLFDVIISVAEMPAKEMKPEKQSVINVDDLKKLTNNDPVFLKEMILLFIQSTEKGMNKMSSAIEKENWQVIADTAHNLAPQCKHMQAMGLYSNLKELEKSAGHQPVLQERIAALYQKVENEVRQINTSLRNYVTRDEKIKGTAAPEQLQID